LTPEHVGNQQVGAPASLEEHYGRGVKPLRYRAGHGYDIHRLQEGGRLVLGGVVVAEGVSCVAHSDGDVALHALVDALLGAMGWGDIGEHFSNTDSRWRGAASTVFLDTVLALIKPLDYEVLTTDITILAERPKIQPYKQAIRKVLSERLSGEINIKAGTNEGCDAIGRGEAIAAHAVVLLEAQFPL
jgi:2-C-methyl-D-erythritol 2,4-cyclodiphosphate synthase